MLRAEQSRAEQSRAEQSRAVKVSVIVPVFNGEKYIKNCIEMLLNQGETYYEIVVINDGSTDNTAQIMQAYQSNRKVLYYEQNNKGVSAARNKGIEISNGDWIMFCDVDDEVKTGYITDIFNQIQENPECDMFCYARYSAGIADYEHDEMNVDNADTLKRILNSDCYGYFLRSVWGTVFKKNFLQQKRVFFHEGIPFSEDTLFMLQAASEYKTIKYIHRGYYKYCLRSDGTVCSGGSEKDLSGYRLLKNGLKQLECTYKMLWKAPEIQQMVSDWLIDIGMYAIGRVRRGTIQMPLQKRKQMIKGMCFLIKSNITIEQKLREKRKIYIIEKLPIVYILMGDLKGKLGR